MGFSTKQVQALRRNLNRRHVQTREANGRELSYIEGWYAISEANRIFGFDGWNRETVDSRCVLARENRGSFLAVYIARVRITVHTDGATIIREGHGSGEGRGASPGEVHDIALKAAETDATKRALATFGKPFGLELYRKEKRPSLQSPSILPPATLSPSTEPRLGFHPDDTTPIPRPSHYYGRRHLSSMNELLRRDQAKTKEDTAAASPLAPTVAPAKIDKSQLAIAEPKRLRDKTHLKFVASQPCLVCGGNPPIRIICALRNRARLASRSAMSSQCRFAAVTTARFIKLATRWRGGGVCKSTHSKSLEISGSNLITRRSLRQDLMKAVGR